MSMTSDTKAIEKKLPGEGRDRGYSGKYKDMGGFNSYRKPRFVGECEDLKDCIFDCEDNKQAGAFEVNMKKLAIYAGTKYDMGAEIMTMIDEMIEVNIKKPELYMGDDVIEMKIHELKIAQYVKSQSKLESECKKFYAVILGQCTEYMIAKMKATPGFKDMHMNKDSLMLLKTIKGLTFQFDGEKEYEMSLVDAMDKLYRMFQTKEMTNTQFRDKFNNLIDIIEHYGGSVGVH